MSQRIEIEDRIIQSEGDNFLTELVLQENIWKKGFATKDREPLGVLRRLKEVSAQVGRK